MIDTLNFIPDPVGELGVIKELLKPDGILVCRVPNARYLLFKNVGVITYLRFGKWSYMNTPLHIIHFTPESLRSMLRLTGFTIVYEDVGRPWMVGSTFNLLAKRGWYGIARLLKWFGYDLGVSIDVWAVPPDERLSEIAY